MANFLTDERALQLTELLLQNDKDIKTEIERKIPSVEGLATETYVNNAIANAQLKGSSTTTGNDGKSAYEIAVDNGFTGTETEWLESLKGADGKNFEYSDFTQEQLDALKGANGYTPVKGTDYWTTDDKAEIQSYIDSQIGGALNGSY